MKTNWGFLCRPRGQIFKWIIGKSGNRQKKDLYIANTVKCRPPENRKPLPNEKIACEGNLFKQIEVVKPKVIILCGSTAVETFIKDKNLQLQK